MEGLLKTRDMDLFPFNHELKSATPRGNLPSTGAVTRPEPFNPTVEAGFLRAREVPLRVGRERRSYLIIRAVSVANYAVLCWVAWDQTR